MKHLKTIAYILVLAIVLCMMPIGAFAEDADEPITDTENGFLQPVSQKTEVPDGYIGIYTAQDMDAIRNNLSGKYILMADIDLAPLGNWEPIGKCEDIIKNIYDDHMNIIDVEYIGKQPFCGTFDGNGHILSGMNINKEYDAEDISFHSVGLFAAAENCTIENLGITDSQIFANGGVRLYAASIVGRQFQNVCIENCFSDTDITATCFYTIAAGIVSSWFDRYGIIRNCINYGKVNAELTHDTEHLNGTLPEPYQFIYPYLTAVGIGFAATIENSVNCGDITVEISGTHGKLWPLEASGIGGYNMIDCVNYGCVKSCVSNCIEKVGELPFEELPFNFIFSSGIGVSTCKNITNCKNYGDVFSEVDAESKITPPDVYAGGIIASGEYSDISGCMNAGTVSANSGIEATAYAGGIVGYMLIYDFEGSIQSSCNCGNVSANGTTAVAGGVVGVEELIFYETRQIYLSNMFNTGDVSAKSNKSETCGGMFGIFIFLAFDTESLVKISNIYNSGELHCSDGNNMGAIAGKAFNVYNVYEGTPLPQAKFVINSAYFSESCENAVGYSSGDIVQNSIVKLTNEQMLDKTSYVGFNFVDVWEIDEKVNSGFPSLRVITGNLSDMKLGDVNMNGRIETGDAVIILKKCADMITLDSTETELADANCDFAINTADAVAVLRYTVGLT